MAVSNTIIQGDALSVLRMLPSESVQMVCTSPPYYGLRAYLPDGHPDKPLEIGLESSPREYIAKLVEVFREMRRVLRSDGTVFLNLGDGYTGSGKGGQSEGKRSENWQPAYAHTKQARSARYRLRADLTSEQQAYVLSELAAFCNVSKEGLPEVTTGIDEAIAPFTGSEKVGG